MKYKTYQYLFWLNYAFFIGSHVFGLLTGNIKISIIISGIIGVIVGTIGYYVHDGKDLGKIALAAGGVMIMAGIAY